VYRDATPPFARSCFFVDLPPMFFDGFTIAAGGRGAGCARGEFSGRRWCGERRRARRRLFLRERTIAHPHPWKT